MKLLFWALLIVVAVAFLGLFSSLLSGLRRRRGMEERAALPAVEWRAVAPLGGRQAALFLRLRQRWPGRPILCDVPYGRFLAGGEVAGVAPLLVCDEALRPRAVVVWDGVDAPVEALRAAGIALHATESDDDVDRLPGP